MSDILGIDPGQTGGIFCTDSSRKNYKLSTCSKNDRDTVENIRSIIVGRNVLVAVVERVASFPGQGSSSTFTFGKRYGVIRGALLALNIPLVDVPSQTWQKALSLSQPKKESGAAEDAKEARKRLAARRKKQKELAYNLASQLYPQLQLTEEVADAVLLAEYGLRTPGILQSQD